MSSATSSSPQARPRVAPSAGGGSRTPGPSPTIRAPRPHGRSSSRAVLAVLLIVAGAAIGAALYLAGDDRTQVVVAARDIPVGTVISAADLTAAEISGGVAGVAGSDARLLLGQSATTRIPAGALLHADMVDPAPPPGEGKVALGLTLSAGQLPAAELTSDRLVEIVQVSAAADAAVQDPTGTVLVPEALVLSVTADASGAWLVTVAVDRDDAPAVAAAAAAGRTTLAMLPVAPTTDDRASGDPGAGSTDGADEEGQG